MEMKEREYKLHDLVEAASFCTLFVQQDILSREEGNPLSVIGVIKLTYRNYQFRVNLFCVCLFLPYFSFVG